MEDSSVGPLSTGLPSDEGRLRKCGQGRRSEFCVFGVPKQEGVRGNEGDTPSAGDVRSSPVKVRFARSLTVEVSVSQLRALVS